MTSTLTPNLNQLDHIVHDLKAPLQIIKKMQESLQFDQDTKDQLSSCTGYLESLISKYFSAKTTNITSHDSIKKTIQSKYELFKEINFTEKHRANIDLFQYLTIDQLDFNRLLFNLISNSSEAFKKSQTKNPQIKIQTSNNENYFILTMSDNGCGFPPNILNGLNSLHRSKGRGIGLSSVTTILKETEGDMTLKNNPNGATVILRFPLIFKKASEVILYEDESLFSSYWKNNLAENNINLIINPTRAPQKDSLIFMDINLGDECGIKKAKELKGNTECNVFFTTNHSRDKVLQFTCDIPVTNKEPPFIAKSLCLPVAL
jgi:two-component sensor histidine kinase